MAGIGAAVNSGDKVIVARNCHKSVYNAIDIFSLRPVYLFPEVDEYGICIDIKKEQVENALKQNPDTKLIIITSPTYEGIISDIREIVNIAHQYGITVFVDEAHGTHLSFDESLRRFEALNSGADIVVQSLHKTLPALTQCAIMHIQGEFVVESKVQQMLDIFQTSSPSYILISSIEECLNIIQTRRKELFERYDKNLDNFYKKVDNLKKLKILKYDNIISDKGKIVIITEGTDISGKELSDILRFKYYIEVEMANVNYIIAMTSICDKDENYDRLADALLEIDKKVNYGKKIDKKIESLEEYIEDSDFVDYKDAIGKISGEYIWIYPPGIPIITPNEVITKEITEKLLQILNANIRVKTDYNRFPYVKINRRDNK